MTVPDLIVVLLRMLELKTPHAHDHHWLRVAQAAPIIQRAVRAERSAQPLELVGAVMVKESSVRWTSDGRKNGPLLVGAAGEVGYMQTKPDGRAGEICADLDIYRPLENVQCGVRLLDLAERECGGEPLDWLIHYNHPAAACGPSEYARRVLAILARAKLAAVLAAEP